MLLNVANYFFFGKFANYINPKYRREKYIFSSI